jgi:hypothetical protein
MVAAYNVIPSAPSVPTNTSSNLGMNPLPASSIPTFRANYTQQNRYENPWHNAQPYNYSQYYGGGLRSTPISGPSLLPPISPEAAFAFHNAYWGSHQAAGYYPSSPTYPIPESRYTPSNRYGTPYVSPYSLGQFSSQNYGNELWSTPISGSSVNTPNASYLPPANTQSSAVNLPEAPSDSNTNDNGTNRNESKGDRVSSSQSKSSAPPLANNAENSAQAQPLLPAMASAAGSILTKTTQEMQESADTELEAQEAETPSTLIKKPKRKKRKHIFTTSKKKKRSRK